MRSSVIFLVFLVAQMVASAEYKMPFVYKLDSGFIPHTLVTVIGQVNKNAKRFTVNFARDKKTLFFHFDPRFFKSPKIALNTLLNGGWQKEESLKYNPIKIGDTFKLGIQCEEQYFKVFLNGKFLVQFKARMHPLSNIKYIEVVGDITLKQMSLSAM
ncbi:galectin-3-like [Ascaphus truei]|uniref:galectin-3-like n=1 Tax=Ascaphus truei TaxID=8439 RepID=UPI003F5945A2